MFWPFKRKEIKIVNKDQLISTLTCIVELLRDNGFTAQANAVKKPLQYLYADDHNNFKKYLLTVDIWGGSGAAWEVYGFDSKESEKEFEIQFIKLAELMAQTGIKSSKAKSIANYFKSEIKRKSESSTYC